MHRVTAASAAALFDVAATRRIEQAAAAALPPHTLMQRAGLAVARLAMALAPDARRIWIACGPGNNGGDGFEAAMHLQQRGFAPMVSFAGTESRLPDDARASLQRAREAGVAIGTEAPPQHDLVIDALLGIGTTRPVEGLMADWLRQMQASKRPVLSVDLPSGLNADTGTLAAGVPAIEDGAQRHCLSLLSLKPGLFTAHGRDAAGSIWHDALGCASGEERPVAHLIGIPAESSRPHASHKGSQGDVAVIGGAPGMAGAALLAGTAALHGGAGRVFVGLLDAGFGGVDVAQPELMLRDAATLDLSGMAVVCGCGGGSAVRGALPRALSTAAALVLDADALNVITADPLLQALLQTRGRRGHPTVLTPHPLEAARLLGCSTAEVQADRLAAARGLATRFHAVAVLKGSGTVVAGIDGRLAINPTGNARLATAGTGDVLAGMLGARLARRLPAFEAACAAVWQHGRVADDWPAGSTLTAAALARGGPG